MGFNRIVILCILFVYVAFVQSESVTQESDEIQKKDKTSTTVADPCIQTPCKNQGTCTPEKDKPKCFCPKNYYGDRCQDKCECRNGICERNNKGKMVCICPPEWGYYTKDYCKKCDCGKGANCTFTGFWGTKTCICKEGYSAKEICEADCSRQPCKNGGTCKVVGEDIVCDCVDPYFGDFCEKKKNSPCSSNPCKNGGTCDDSSGKVVCKCGGTFIGEFCETDACNKNPCQNNGKCTVLNGKANCTCAEGFSGNNCENDACTKNPCQNNGKCTVVKGKANCTCAEGFSGKNCENDACTLNPCLNGGTCKLLNGKANCTCVDGFYGKKCEAECKCENGKCQDKQGSWICVCNPEYGIYEKGVCKACDCGKGANCTFDVGFFLDTKTCICPKGFVQYEEKCVDPNDHDPCHSSPCSNGGTCTKHGLEAVCICLPRYDGKWCEKDRCSPNPCQNKGVCAFLDGKVKCSCQDPFTGEKCEKNLCSPNPCNNKGECKARDGKFNCTCKVPFSGPLCETDPCSSKPCKNGATCQIVGDSFKCLCKDSYYGKVCNITCTCKNGKCVEEKDSVLCLCNPEFGLYRDGVCQACNCGKEANCTFDKTLRKTKTCVCPKGFEEQDGKCQDVPSTLAPTTPTFMSPSSVFSTFTSPATNSTTEEYTSENANFTEISSSSSIMTPNGTDSANETMSTETVTVSTPLINETSTSDGNMSTETVTEAKTVSDSTTSISDTTPNDLLTTKETVVTDSTSSVFDTTANDLSSTTESGGKKCKKNPCKNGGVCFETKTEQVCQCPYPYGGELCMYSYWCSEGPGKDMCQQDNCDFNFITKVGTCNCSKDEYYDYENSVCRTVDKCPLTSDKCKGSNEICKDNECQCIEHFKRNEKQKCVPNFCESAQNKCGENTVCQDIETDPGNVKCTCKDGFVFNGKTCVKINKCDIPSILGCQQICNNETETCECQIDFDLQPDKKTCKLSNSSSPCKTSCGPGTCVKTEDGEVCVCPQTHSYNGKTCIDLCTAKKIPPGLCPNDACLPDASLGFRCKCEGLLTYEANKVTCRRKLMCSEAKGTSICAAVSAKCIDNFSNAKGFVCICSEGEEMDADGICKRKCDIKKYKDNCLAKQAVCEMIGSKDICKCPPLQTMNEKGVCTELASDSYEGLIPFARSEYVKKVFYDASAAAVVVPDYEKMRQDLRASMHMLYGKTYKFADVLNCSDTSPSLKCVVEIQFDSDPKDQIKLIGQNGTCISAKIDMCFIPPELKLWKKDLSPGMLSKTDPCMNEIKQSNCGGTETECNKAKDGSSNYMCTCTDGFKAYATFNPVSDTRTVIHRCQDIDECLIAKACPNRTRCMNTYGSYECFCQDGYKPKAANANPKISGCVGICNPNPCGKGKCEIQGSQFTCLCGNGYTGSKCDKKIQLKEESPGAKIALIALSTMVVPLVLFSLFMIYRYRILSKKVSRSNYIDDNSSTINLRPMNNRH